MASDFHSLAGILLLLALCIPPWLGLRTVPVTDRKRPVWMEIALNFLWSGLILTPLILFIWNTEVDIAFSCSIMLCSALVAPFYATRISWGLPWRQVLKACMVSLGCFLLEAVLFLGASVLFWCIILSGSKLTRWHIIYWSLAGESIEARDFRPDKTRHDLRA